MMSFQYDDLIGIPFLINGRTKTGLDCFGLVIECMSRIGIKVPDPFQVRYKDAVPGEDWQAWLSGQFGDWEMIDEAIFGSVVVFARKGRPDHAGVMLDHQRFIHAIEKAGIVIGRLDRCPHKLLGFYVHRD